MIALFGFSLEIFLCPLFLSTNDKLSPFQYITVLQTFAISTFFAAIFTLAIGYYNYLNFRTSYFD